MRENTDQKNSEYGNLARSVILLQSAMNFANFSGKLCYITLPGDCFLSEKGFN